MARRAEAEPASPDWYSAVRGGDERGVTAVQLWLRAQPGAAKSRLVGLHGERLKVALQAPPVDGKANDELLRLLAELFGVPRARLQLAAGQASRDKRVDVALPRPQVLAALAAVLARP